MHPTLRSVAAALLGAALALPAQAGRPLQTEDAGVLDRGSCELEGAAARESASGASAREASLQFGCGIGWDSQVALNAAHAKADGDSARALALHVNLGQARDETGNQRSTTWGLAFEHAGFGALAPMAEVFGDDRGAPWWNLGLRLAAVPDKAYVDLSYGRRIGDARARLLGAGFRVVY